MSNEELYQARLDRLLGAITKKEILIESLQKKTSKQKTIEELREQFEERFKYMDLGVWCVNSECYYDRETQEKWLMYRTCASLNNLIKEGKHE